MKDPGNRITVEGFYDQVRPLGPLEAEALERMPLDLPGVLASLGLERLDEPAGRGFYERLVAWPTFTVNGLHGGYGGPGTQTILPNQAVAKCDLRLVPDQTAGDVLAKLRAHVARHAPGVELIAGGSMEPSRTPIDSPFTGPIRRGLAAATGEEPLLVPPLGGSLPAYVFTSILGLPTFGVPLANPDQTNHAPNENLVVERFIGGIKVAASVLAHLGSMPRPETRTVPRGWSGGRVGTRKALAGPARGGAMVEIVTQAVDGEGYQAEVTVDTRRYTYQVSVPDDLAERVGADPATIVRATVAFLLDRKPPTSIMRRFDCSVVAGYFPEYEAELPRYLEGPGSAS
jgi:Peptidase dimerisation domain